MLFYFFFSEQASGSRQERSAFACANMDKTEKNNVLYEAERTPKKYNTINIKKAEVCKVSRVKSRGLWYMSLFLENLFSISARGRQTLM